jgi:hypothetical protein
MAKRIRHRHGNIRELIIVRGRRAHDEARYPAHYDIPVVISIPVSETCWVLAKKLVSTPLSRPMNKPS